ncbi:hypothetical protein RJT34_19124 [Clitoria ternatea]|uniref:Uncharacterized protein n=1 Tax=Clitoria ternatea TaxID=43366 RepID=A0AAN9IQX0_CLITE
MYSDQVNHILLWLIFSSVPHLLRKAPSFVRVSSSGVINRRHLAVEALPTSNYPATSVELHSALQLVTRPPSSNLRPLAVQLRRRAITVDIRLANGIGGCLQECGVATREAVEV